MNDITSIAKLLNLPEDEVTILSTERSDDGTVTVVIEKTEKIVYCTECGTRMLSKGIYLRKVNHPVLNGPYAGKVVLKVKQRKWKCPHCGAYSNDSFSFLGKGKQSTDILPLMILEEMKDPNVTCKQVASRLHISDTTVHYTFMRYVEMKRLSLSRIISIDEVHLDLDNKHRYAMVIMDFITNEIIDILPGRGKAVTDAYFASISKEERNRVKFVVSDMYKPYIAYSGDIFPNATPVVDSFHVISWLLNKINLYINEVKKRYQAEDRKKLSEKNYKTNSNHKTTTESREVTLLKRHRWILLKNKDNINYSEKSYRVSGLGGSYLNTYQLEKMFLDLDPHFREIRSLKELYINFNKDNINTPNEAAIELDELITTYKNSSISLFNEFGELLNSYKNEIIASFNYISIENVKAESDSLLLVKRISNGPMEGFNNIPKDIKRISNGLSNFDYVRSRILWCTRKHVSMLGVPKAYDDVCSSTGKKRGPYKKK